MTTKRGDIKLMIERIISVKNKVGIFLILYDAVELFEKLDSELAFERQEHHTFKLAHANLCERKAEYKTEIAALKSAAQSDAARVNFIVSLPDDDFMDLMANPRMMPEQFRAIIDEAIKQAMP